MARKEDEAWWWAQHDRKSKDLSDLHELRCQNCEGLIGYTAGVPDGACAFFCTAKACGGQHGS